MANPKRLYWDACVWIAIIQRETAVPLKGGGMEDRYSMCEAVLADAEEGKFEIATSCFSLAEVCQGTNDGRADDLPNFFERDCIITIPVDFEIGSAAQTLQSKDNIGLSPQDATHVASAIRAKADLFNTFDAGILKLNGKILRADGSPLPICKPGENE